MLQMIVNKLKTLLRLDIYRSWKSDIYSMKMRGLTIPQRLPDRLKTWLPVVIDEIEDGFYDVGCGLVMFKSKNALMLFPFLYKKAIIIVSLESMRFLSTTKRGLSLLIEAVRKKGKKLENVNDKILKSILNFSSGYPEKPLSKYMLVNEDIKYWHVWLTKNFLSPTCIKKHKI